MRTSLSQQVQRALMYMNSANIRLSNAQDRAATGKRIARASYDVPGTNQALSLRSAINSAEQLADNIKVSQPLLKATEGALNDLVQAVRTVRDITALAAKPELVEGTNDASIASLKNILDQMQDLANTKHLDQYIFSGTATDTATVVKQVGTPPYAYTGGSGVRQTQVLAWVTMPVGIPGSQVFNFDGSAGVGTPDMFSMITDVISAIQTGDPKLVSAELDDIDAVYDNLLTCSAQVGSWSARMGKAQTTLSETTNRLQQMLSDVEDVDLPTAVIDLKTEENVYQTALAVSSRILDLSLASNQYLK